MKRRGFLKGAIGVLFSPAASVMRGGAAAAGPVMRVYPTREVAIRFSGSGRYSQQEILEAMRAVR